MTQMDNILSIKHAISERLRNVRRVAKISQIAGEISLASLLKLAMALGYESDFNNLFTRKNYQSIFDVVKDGGNDAK